MLSVTEINEIDRFLELKHEWNNLLERSSDSHIFLTWEWQSTYWKHFGEDKDLRILCIRDKDKIIAIAPLRQSRYGFAYFLGYNVIEPLGYRAGLSSYSGLILSERAAKCLKLFLNHLSERDDWDFIYLFDVPGTSRIPELLPEVSGAIPSFEFTQGVMCPYVSVPNSMEIFMKGLSKKFRKNLRAYLRNLKKDYQRVELKRYDEFGSVEDAMKICFDLHQQIMKSEGLPGVFGTQKIREFSLDVAKRFASKGWLALYFLTANDKPIAVLYCVEYKQKMYAYVSGRDLNYSEYSVGNLILGKVMEKCVQKKMKEFDLLKGGDRYKFRWATGYRRNLTIKFVNRKFTSTLYHWGIRKAKQMKLGRTLGRFLDS